MAVLKFIWRAMGVVLTIQWAYWGVMFTGAWLNLNEPPTLSTDWIALAMFGAMFSSSEVACPGILSASRPRLI